MGTVGHSLKFTAVLGEGRIETAGALSVDQEILSEGLAHNMGEPNDQG